MFNTYNFIADFIRLMPPNLDVLTGEADQRRIAFIRAVKKPDPDYFSLYWALITCKTRCLRLTIPSGYQDEWNSCWFEKELSEYLHVIYYLVYHAKNTDDMWSLWRSDTLYFLFACKHIVNEKVANILHQFVIEYWKDLQDTLTKVKNVTKITSIIIWSVIQPNVLYKELLKRSRLEPIELDDLFNYNNPIKLVYLINPPTVRWTNNNNLGPFELLVKLHRNDKYSVQYALKMLEVADDIVLQLTNAQTSLIDMCRKYCTYKWRPVIKKIKKILDDLWPENIFI